MSSQLLACCFLLYLGGLVNSVTLREYWERINRYDAATGSTENFDPARANPVRNITCVGDSFNLQLPMIGGFDPNQVTPQKICVKPQYNGGARGQHAGGYCLRPPFNGFAGEVAFDNSPGAEASAVLQNPRVLMACRYRCFCNWNYFEPNSVSHQGLPLQTRPSQSTYELQLDVENDFTTPYVQKRGRQGTAIVNSVRIATQSQLSLEHGQQVSSAPLSVSLDPGNRIRCVGGVPTFSIPQLRGSHYNVQSLCATELSGGARFANVGGYCHRSDTPWGPKSEVWFSDDMTPQVDWTWTGGQFFATASIRFFCSQHCLCTQFSNPKGLSPSGQRLWSFVAGHPLTERSDGSLYLEDWGFRIVEVLPSQKGPFYRSGTCGANGRDFCPQAWDERLLGQVPRAPPGATDIVKNKTSLNVCGNTCHGPSDCSSDSRYSCSCAFPSPSDARKLNLDPVFPVSVCLALFVSVLESNKLGGRGIPSYVNAQGIAHTCRCNDTVVGVECCGPTNGKPPGIGIS